MLPFISVVLPVRNERAMLPRLIDELLEQNYPADRFEILVVDGRSTDGTADLVRRRYCAGKRVKIRVLDNPKMRSSAGRNIGIRAANADAIVFIDGHCSLPSRNLLEDTAAILQQTGAGCLCRPQPLLAHADTKTGEVIAQACASWLGHDRNSLIDDQVTGFVDPATTGSVYLREVFKRVGFYDESFDGCEDIEFNTRVSKAGIRAYTDPRLAVYYQPRRNVRGLFGQMVRHGRGRLRLARKHPETFSKSQLIPLAVLLMVVLTPLAWAFLPRAAARIATIPLALCAAAVALASLQLGLRYGFAALWRAPRIFAGMYCGLGAGWLLESLLPQKPVHAPAVVEVLHPAPEPEAAVETRRAA
jgi:succinoglycan biosynthesis protein ExoA